CLPQGMNALAALGPLWAMQTLFAAITPQRVGRFVTFSSTLLVQKVSGHLCAIHSKSYLKKSCMPLIDKVFKVFCI
ncbi:MAG: hypothetical protein ACI4QS_04075, partial [Comamonas sp.]